MNKLYGFSKKWKENFKKIKLVHYPSEEKLDKIAWVGNDKFDQKIEIIAINFITYYYVIHVMPVSKRGDEKNDYLEGLW